MRLRVALVAVGAVLIAYAVIGALGDAEADPVGIAVFLAAVLVGHDALWMPLVLAAGALLARTSPVTRIAALVAASIGVVALPLVLGLGRPADNPSVLPLRYGRHLALILLVIALVAAVRAVIRRKTARRRLPRAR